MATSCREGKQKDDAQSPIHGEIVLGFVPRRLKTGFWETTGSKLPKTRLCGSLELTLGCRCLTNMQNVRNDDKVQTWFCMRALLRSLACSAVLIPSISRALAQFPSSNPTSSQIEESMKAQATSANIQTWLESKDPRLIAWGAYFARENNDTAALDLAAQLVKRSLVQGGPDLLSPDRPHYDALSEVLDALIQRRVLLSAEFLGYVSRSHPVQTIILLSMLPSAEQTENLMQWYGGARPGGPDHLERVSAMFLSKSPPPGFAANILASSEERLVVYVVPTKGMGVGFGGGSGGVCSDFGISRPPVGWPDIPWYHLTQNDNSGIDPLLVESGGDRIFWQRSGPGGSIRTCAGQVTSLTPETRHHLLAEMLGQRDEAMSWPTQKVVNIAKESDEQVQRDIGATIQAEQAILLKSVQDFQTRGFITPEEARTVLPKLSVTIRYDGSLKRTE